MDIFCPIVWTCSLCRRPRVTLAGVRLGPGLCLVFCAGLGGCAAAPPEGPIVPSITALGGPDATLIDEAASPDQDATAGATSGENLVPRARTGNPWADCYRDFQPSDDPAVDLVRLTAACAARAGFVAVTPLHAGTQDRDDPPERLTFRVHSRRCYRAFAVGAPSVLDLDVAIKEEKGRIIAGDMSRDRWPIVPPRGPLCAPKGERYTVELSVADGRGAYLFQIWGSPEEEDEEEDSAP
jgi:hypothetical protein